jgi:threonine aldolase
MRERLVEDHRNAKRLAEGLAEIPGVRIDPRRVVTNIVSFEIDPAVMDAGSFQKACAEKGLRVSRYLGNSPRLRAVTHLDVKRDDIDAALDIARAVLVGTRAPVTAGR